LRGKVGAVRSASRLAERELIAEAEEFFALQSQGSRS
jgi:hypothetical protein